MRVKSLGIVIILNISLMLFVTVIQEYISLSERFQQLESNIQVSLDTAIKTAVGSEELFTDTSQWDFKALSTESSVLSVGQTGDTGMPFFFKRDCDFGKVNAYVLSMYYSKNGCLPESKREYKVYLGQLTGHGAFEKKTENLTDAIYSYLYVKGGVAKKHDIKTQVYGLKPNKDLQNFYDSVGADLTAKTYVRCKTSSDPYRFKVKTDDFPILWNMGLNFKGGSSKANLRSDYSSVDLAYSGSTVTTNNWGVVKHVGKRISESNTVTKSVYYLTPSSLGVTYVPPTVLRTSFIANLDTLVRLQKASGGTLGYDDRVKYKATMNSASGCVPTSVYVHGVPQNHICLTTNAKSNIVNDGSIEYDLSSAQIKIDYSTIDFYQNSPISSVNRSKSLMAGRLFGFNFDVYPSYKTTDWLRDDTLGRLKYNDTRRNTKDLFDESLDGKRVVARVTCKIKIHAMYESSILQWLCWLDHNKYSVATDEHFDVKLYDPTTNSGKHGFIRNSDGLWYTYTTYYMTTR